MPPACRCPAGTAKQAPKYTISRLNAAVARSAPVDELSEWLSLLPEPQLDRLAENVLGAQPSSRALTERALAQRLSDAAWAHDTLEMLGAQAKAAAQTLLDAAVPVRRTDL